MKKILSLAFAFFAFLWATNAQTYLLNEGFEDPAMALPTGWTVIDNDGDGNNWYVLNNSQSSEGGFVVHTGAGHITSASWASVALTPDNWLITPQLNLNGNYLLTFWVAGQDPSYAAENFSVYVATSPTVAAFTATTAVLTGTSTATMTQYTVNLSSYNGQQVYIAFRHHNISDVFRINLDDVQVMEAPSDPTIVTVDNIDFGTHFVGNEAVMAVTVSAYNLTSAITASATAPFTISTDTTNFGATATIPQAGGTLYVKYAPTAAGASNGTITLSANGLTDVTINVSGNCLDCDNVALPYSCDFSDAANNQCWSIVDANNDGSTFTISGGEAYYTFNSNNAANDYLISPTFTFTGTQTLTFDYAAYSSSYPEMFEVLAIGADTVVLAASETVSSVTPLTKVINLSNLNGNYAIAIHCVSAADMWRFIVDNFSILNANESIVSVDATTLNFGVLAVGNTSNNQFNISTTNLNEAITVTTAAPFSVSLDNTAFSASVTIPADTTFITNTPVYVRFAPTSAGSVTGNVVVTTTNTADTVALAGTAVECNVINQFPFVETFASTSPTLPCWSIEDANNDGTTFLFGTYGSAPVAGYNYHSTNAANDYLISPEIAVTAGVYGHVDYMVRGSSYPEKFSIYVIPENGTIANAVNIVPTQTVTNTTPETQNFDLAAYNNQTVRIAIKAESDPNEFTLFFQNFVIDTIPSTPELTVTPASMSFTTIAGITSDAQVASVSAYSLENDITITASAPYEVSLDGTTFGATATIPQALALSTSLYVRFAPTTAGAQTGTVTLTSGSLSASISLNGNAIDCFTAQALPFAEGFESELSDCWINIDNDGDGYSWHAQEGTAEKPAHSGNYCYTSESYINNLGALHPDNWLILPPLAIPSEGAHVSWWVAAQDPNYPADYYEVKVSTSTPDMSAFSTVYSETISSGDWEARNVNLDYAGQTIYIAFVHTNCSDNFRMKIDDISVAAGVGINDVENNISIYPNPASSVLNVNANSNIQSVEVMNQMGQTIQIELANGLNTQINTSSLSNGVYMLRVTTENGVINQKFTVAR